MPKVSGQLRYVFDTAVEILKMPKILFITPRYPPTIIGGGEISLKILAEKLAEVLDVTVLSLDGNIKEKINGVKITRKTFRKGILGNLSLLCYLLKIQKEYDLIHGYNMFFYHYLGLLSCLIRKPVFVTLNNIPDYNRYISHQYQSNIKRSLKYFFIERIAFKISLSESLRKHYVDIGFKERKINVIPNMLDEKVISVAQVDRFKTNKLRIVYVGMLYRQKGVDILIRAFKKCLDEGIKATLTVVGDGPERENLISLAKELNVKASISFTGKIDYSDIYAFYNGADLLVHPARFWEAFGRTIIEAMSLGLPVIVSDVGAPPEIVGEKMLIFKSEDYVDLSRKIKRLYANHTLVNRLTVKLRNKSENYRSYFVLRQLVQYYNKGLEKYKIKKIDV
jgi:alpha-maltose-1-phosphate synthase